MKLYEFEAKQILSTLGIPTPQGILAASAQEAKEKASKLHPPYVVKAQVLVAGRGKAGGIKFAENLDEVEEVSAKILGNQLKGLKIDRVWIEEKIEIAKELYFGITTDRTNRCRVAIVSSEGGVDIEEVSSRSPEKIMRMLIDPALGFRAHHARQIASWIGYTGKAMLQLATLFERLYRAAVKYDAELIEMNPLVETARGTFEAADARLIIDDNALYRHPEYKARLLSEQEKELTSEEIEAREAGLAYVRLNGNIGILGNGAGLVMATLDVVQLHGGEPANFLDVGGGASQERIVSALDILMRDLQASVILINILGGITRCDSVAKGILKTRNEIGFTKPIIIRLVGTKEKEGRSLLAEAGIPVLDSMEEAAKKAVELSKRR